MLSNRTAALAPIRSDLGGALDSEEGLAEGAEGLSVLPDGDSRLGSSKTDIDVLVGSTWYR